jgi:asparagine synthase (glutamine-hydrolysing)
MSPEVRSALRDGASRAILDAWSDWLPCVEGASEFEQVLWIQSRTRMPDYINHNLDRTSMAHSVEARPPFLDHELWEFCASIPVGLKLRNATEKYLLREAGRGAVPQAARVRPKAPLRVPYYRLVSQPRLPDWAETALGAERLNGTALFDAKAVQELRREVQAGNLAKATLLMSILTAQVWSRIFLESPLTASEWR